MSVLINIHDLKHAYPHQTLFEGLTFSIYSGEKIALIGQNGAGKSTLMKIMLGEMQADEGRVTRSKGLKVGYLSQSPTFTKNLTVHDAILGAHAHTPPEELNWEIAGAAEEAMSRLNLAQYEQMQVTDLSGGWQKKVALARELAQSPDVLLLDEPTNHLDIESILWLEDWVQDSPLCIVVVSHDRAFLQNTAKRVIEIDKRNPNGILSVDGTYDEFLKVKEDYIEGQISREASLKNTLRREVEWLKRGAKARTTKQKARIDRAGDLQQEVQTLSYKNRTQSVTLEFDSSESGPKKMAELKKVTKSFPDPTLGTKTLFKNLDLKITNKTRLGLFGKNGTGKSTLIRLIVGEEKPDSGEIQVSDRMQAAYFNQNRETLDQKLTVLRTVCTYGETVEFQGRKMHVRSYLDRFLFSGGRIDMQVSKLSGGEQARLLLALLMLTPANLLILDEPTNDLDLQTLGILEECLEEFPGAVILVTHDRAFMDNVCDQILGFPEMHTYSDLRQWEKAYRASLKNLANTSSGAQAQATAQREAMRVAPSAANPAQERKKKLSYKEQLEFDKMERTIHEKELELQTLSDRMVAPEIVSAPLELKKIMAEMASLQTEIEVLYERWSDLEAKQK